MEYRFLKKSRIHIIAIAMVVLIAACHSSNTRRTEASLKNEDFVMLYAGASLSNVLNEIIDAYQKRYGVRVQTNFASSGTLARQIKQVEAPDVFVSASKKWADYVDSLGVVQPGYTSIVASNRLVLIAPLNSTIKTSHIDSSLNILEALGEGRLAMGDPSHVPAGKYAKQALSYYGWYGELINHILPAKDVRSALMVVELGEAPLGVVYLTDAIESAKVKIVGAFPLVSHEPILFVASVCNDRPKAKEFYAFMQSEMCKPIWDRHGFK
ncbi:molybdate ABC transporter substrate-binding protein [Saccharicrinis fermentans]|uniref:Molybdate-binding periplasmic protein n=1 Tax=Saccharicrinis fermentans DSM 9555 = JCM 21142 TaxID=869213 RepID=W7Y436_9BACT|nr:molybdate ABC transporter substrate-binding protein [Saccharicrinis fermentans]GAF05630.1 molybdate-binding periplasmic protein precursor [Saccharicrinis fermentans DSM 9555 = JCM 21142]